MRPAGDPISEDLRRGETVGRLLFLIAGGLLLAMLVSCACNPVR